MPNYFDDEDENIDDSYLLAQNDPQDGRINPVTKAPVIDMKTNPRITKPAPGESLLPTEEKSEYWREEFRRGKDPREVLNQYLLDRLTQREREASPSYALSRKEDRRQGSRDSMNMDLMKSVSDLGASFGNRRYSDPNSAVPVSGFDPEKPKGYMKQYKADVMGDQKRAEGLQGMDQQVLMYLADKKAKEEQSKADAKLKMDIAKMRAENDPFKSLLFGMKQAEENRQKGEYEMRTESHKQKTEENRRKYNPANVKEKLDNMNSTEKATTGFVSEGLRALNDLEKAEKLGREEHNRSGGVTKWVADKSGAYPWRVSVIGDNPYTEASNRYKEFFGRMQSGGAIGTTEAGEFLGLIPKVLDAPDIAETKINKMKEMFYNKARILGLESRDIDDLIGGADKEPSQSEKALKWYQDPANKSDPNYKGVGDRLKREGLIK